MPGNVFVDTTVLVNLAKSGTASNPFAGLDTLLLLRQNIILTDAVLYEALRADKPDVDVIRQWLIKNKITAEPTNNDLIGRGNGEASIAELINDPQFSNQPYTIISDNKRDFSKDAIASKYSVDQSKIQTTVETLNELHDGGKGPLSSENYAPIRDNMNANAASTPGALGDTRFSSRPLEERLLSNEQLGVTPYRMPDNRIVYSNPAAVPPTSVPVDVKGPGLPPAGVNPQKSVGEAFSKFTEALKDEGAAAVATKAFNGAREVLGKAGMLVVLWDASQSGARAAQQAWAGDTTGAVRTLSDFGARTAYGALGAMVGADVGAGVGAGVGLAYFGPPGALVGGAAGRLIGSVGGAYYGVEHGPEINRWVAQQLANAIQTLADAASADDVTATGSYQEGINTSDGGSTVVTHNPANDNISDSVETFSGPNGTGRLATSLTNYRDGGSLLATSTDPMTLGTYVLYTGPNETGEPVGRWATYPDGHSVNTTYKAAYNIAETGDNSFVNWQERRGNISRTVDISSDTGVREVKVTDYDNGPSVITAYAPVIDPSLGISKIQWNYSQPDGRGTPLEVDVNLSDGSSQRRTYELNSDTLSFVETYNQPGTPSLKVGTTVSQLRNTGNVDVGSGSEVVLSDPHTVLSWQHYYFSGTNATGTLLLEKRYHDTGGWESYDYSPRDGAKEITTVYYPVLSGDEWKDIIKNYPDNTSTVERVRDYGRSYSTYLYNEPNGAGDPVRLLHQHGYGVDYDYDPSRDMKPPNGSVSTGGSYPVGGGSSGGGYPADDGSSGGGYYSGGGYPVGGGSSGGGYPADDGSSGGGYYSGDTGSIGAPLGYTPGSAGDPVADLRAFIASVGAAVDAVRSGPVADLLNRFVYPPAALQMARLLATGTDLYSSIISPGDTNWFRVALSAGTTYWFNAEGSSTGRGTISDPYLRLLGTDGRSLLASDQGSGVGLNSSISYTPTETGTYYMEAGSSGSSTGTYFLTERVADDYSNNPAKTGTLFAGGSAEGNYNFVADTDWFRTALTAGTTYRFDASSTPTGPGTQIHPLLRLLGDHGATEVASDLSAGALGGGYSASLSYTPAVSGDYYISVGSYGTNIGTYRLSQAIVTGATPSTERVADDYPSDPATTGTLAAGGSVEGSYDLVADTDWFRTTLTAGTTYRFDAESTPTGPGTQIHPLLRLLGDHGATEVASDLSAGQLGGGYNASLSYTPTVSGTYYVSVGSYGTNIGTYRLSETTISGAAPSSVAGSRMSFIAGSDDIPPATTAAPVTATLVLQPVDDAVMGAFSDLSVGAISPGQLFASAGSVTQPQYTAGDGTQRSAASLMLATSGYTTSDVPVISYLPAQ